MGASPGVCLEARVESHKERVVGGCLEDVFLRLHPVDVLIIRHHLLLDDFHGVNASRLLQLNHQNFGVAATPDHPDQVEVVDGYDLAFALGCCLVVLGWHLLLWVRLRSSPIVFRSRCETGIGQVGSVTQVVPVYFFSLF